MRGWRQSPRRWNKFTRERVLDKRCPWRHLRRPVVGASLALERHSRFSVRPPARVRTKRGITKRFRTTKPRHWRGFRLLGSVPARARPVARHGAIDQDVKPHGLPAESARRLTIERRIGALHDQLDDRRAAWCLLRPPAAQVKKHLVLVVSREPVRLAQREKVLIFRVVALPSLDRTHDLGQVLRQDIAIQVEDARFPVRPCKPPDSNQTASTKAGAVQAQAGVGSWPAHDHNPDHPSFFARSVARGW